MIPADGWHDNGDGTAWLVTDSPFSDMLFKQLDRPCDTCDGDGSMWAEGVDFPTKVCLDCSGTGRHTFTVEVECQACPEFGGIAHKRTFRVSVVKVELQDDGTWRVLLAVQSWPPLGYRTGRAET